MKIVVKLENKSVHRVCINVCGILPLALGRHRFHRFEARLGGFNAQPPRTVGVVFTDVLTCVEKAVPRMIEGRNKV